MNSTEHSIDRICFLFLLLLLFPLWLGAFAKTSFFSLTVKSQEVRILFFFFCHNSSATIQLCTAFHKGLLLCRRVTAVWTLTALLMVCKGSDFLALWPWRSGPLYTRRKHQARHEWPRGRFHQRHNRVETSTASQCNCHSPFVAQTSGRHLRLLPHTALGRSSQARGCLSTSRVKVGVHVGLPLKLPQCFHSTRCASVVALEVAFRYTFYRTRMHFYWVLFQVLKEF